MDRHYVLRVPESLDPAAAAPLLCAGITTYSPLRHFEVEEGDVVGVVGLGGLGHMAVKLAKAMGAEVKVFTTSEDKFAAARELGADDVILSRDTAAMEAANRSIDVIIDTVAAPHDLNPYFRTLRLRRRAVPAGPALRGDAAGQSRRADPAPDRLRGVADRRHRRDPGDAGLLRRARRGRPTSRWSAPTSSTKPTTAWWPAT